MRTKLITLIVLAAALAGAVLLTPAGRPGSCVKQNRQDPRITCGRQPSCRGASGQDLETLGSLPYQ
jgi:hypothetical protein